VTQAGQPASGRLHLGSCPDSWGVWFADDPRQTPWQRFLDELAGVDYQWLELGPYGYLPTDPARLADELDRRGLKVAGGTMHGESGLHRSQDWPSIVDKTRRVAALTAAVGGQHVITLSSSQQAPSHGRYIRAGTRYAWGYRLGRVKSGDGAAGAT